MILRGVHGRNLGDQRAVRNPSADQHWDAGEIHPPGLALIRGIECFTSSEATVLQLILLVILAGLPALGLILYTGYKQHRLSAEHAQRKAMQLCQVVSLYQDRVMAGSRQLLIILSELPEVRHRDGAAGSARFAGLLLKHPEYATIAVADDKGNLFGRALPFDSPLSAADRTRCPRPSTCIIARQFNRYVDGKNI